MARDTTDRVRPIRILAVCVLAAALLALAPWAAADECAPTDPNCLLDTVDETVGPIEDTTQPVIDDVEKQVGTITGGGGDDGVDPVPGDDPGTDENPQPGDGGRDEKRSERAGNDPRRTARDRSPTSASDAAHTRAPRRDVEPAPTLAAIPVTRADQPTLVERIGQAGARAAKSLALVLVLAGLVVGFVLIQDRMDRKDPKLMLAPLDSEELRFT